MKDSENEERPALLKLFGRLLCLLGLHDFRIIEQTFGFGTGSVEKVECKRCARVATRRA